MVLTNKQQPILIGENVKHLAQINLFFAMALALVTTIWAVYLNEFFHNPSYTGYLSTVLSFVGFLSYYVLVPIVEKTSKKLLLNISVILFVLFYLAFYFVQDVYLVITLAIAMTFAGTVRVAVVGIFLKDNSGDVALSRSEGLMYTFLNLGWVIGPLLAGYIANSIGTRFVFVFAAVFLLIALAMFNVNKFKSQNTDEVAKKGVIKNALEFFSDKRRVLAYLMAGGTYSWWVLIYLFMPLFLIENGFNYDLLGYFLFAIAIPLILFEYRTGKLPENFGFRKIFIAGTLIVSVFTLLCLLTSNIYVVMLLLIFASFGMAFLEPNTEAYFLSIVDNRQVNRFFGPYMTSRDLGQGISKLIPSFMLMFLPFQSIFIFFGVYMFLVFLLALTIKN